MQQDASRVMIATTIVVVGVVFFIVEYGSSRLGNGARRVGTALLTQLSKRRKGFNPDVA